jgi:hypothetical protein
MFITDPGFRILIFTHPGSRIPKTATKERDEQKYDARPGSGKKLFRIPDPGIKNAPDPLSGSATLLSTV